MIKTDFQGKGCGLSMIEEQRSHMPKGKKKKKLDFPGGTVQGTGGFNRAPALRGFDPWSGKIPHALEQLS